MTFTRLQQQKKKKTLALIRRKCVYILHNKYYVRCLHKILFSLCVMDGVYASIAYVYICMLRDGGLRATRQRERNTRAELPWTV